MDFKRRVSEEAGQGQKGRRVRCLYMYRGEVEKHTRRGCRKDSRGIASSFVMLSKVVVGGGGAEWECYADH